jgi:hypothetical protein
VSIFKNFLDNIKAIPGTALYHAGTTLENIKGIPGSIKGVPTAFKALTGGSPYLSEEERQKERILYDNVRKGLSDTDKFLSNFPGWGLQKKGAAATGDLLLRGAIALNENVVSPYFRGISTAALLDDPNSPLFKKGEYEEGFQFKDIKAAWNRSAEVSMFQALTKSDLLPGLTPLSKLVLSTNNIDLNEVDLWNNESIQQNFVDNAVGRWFTGIGDFVVGTVALGGAGRAATIPAKFGLTKAGVYTKTKTVEQLAEDMDAGIQYAKTNGATGRQTISGNHAVTLAESQDWGLITRMVSRYSTNDKLIPLIHEATDAGAVKDLLLADKGNIAALARLAETAPDKLFDMSDTASFLQSKYLLTGKSVTPDEVSAPRLKAAYDAAIKSNPQFIKIRDAFFDPKYGITPGGRNFMPMEPVIGKGLAISAGKKARSVNSALTYREFGKFADIMETTLGSGASRIAVSLVKFGTRQSEYKPLGFVTFSGVRPLDGRIELNQFLNNIKLFRDGEKMIEVSVDGTKRKVADIRRDFEDMFIRSLGKNEVETLDKIDSTIGRYLAYSAKFYDEKEINAHIAKYRSNINEGIEGFKKNKYGIGIDGRQILTDDPQTIRQLVESYRFTPWDSIENAFIEASGKSVGLKTRAPQVAGALGAQVFRDLNRLWTFDVLVRPMYIVKQSLGEPILSATLAQGMTFLLNDLTYTGMNALRNGYMRTREISSKIKNRKARNSVNRTVLAKKEEYSRISAIKDDAQASLEDLLSANSSPATRTQHLAAAREQLKVASALLDEVELDLRSAIKPFGKAEAIPSMTTLERRLAFLEAKPGLGANKQELAKAKKAISDYRNTINKLTMNKKEIVDADNKVAAAYKSVDKILDELGEALKDQADVWGKSAKFKKRWFAKASQYRLLDNGEYVSIDSFTNPTSPFGTAILAETKNTKTAEINMLGEYSTGVRANLVKRKVPSDVIKISDPQYFDELAYVANRTMRGDPLVDLILNNTSMAGLQKWAASDAGIRYLRLFNITEKSQVNSYLADKIALVNRTFPSQEARLAILKREVTAQELQSMLASYTDELFDVVPTNFNYSAGNMGGVNPYKRLSNTVDAASSEVFKFLLKPENPIRRAYFEKVAADVVARKASYLVSQGVDITPNQLNALRQSAGREALEELEKTFYTTRRQNRLLYTARAAIAFPNANVNAFYRYGRIAANNPVRTTQFVSNYGRLFQSFGIDENGNPTKDVNEITHLIVPGTEEMGFGYMDQGTALSARSLGFILNNFSPSFIGALSVGKIMQSFPGTEKGIREIMDSTGIYSFDDVFPYGAPTKLTKQLTPPWANALWNAATQNQGKSDYISSWNSVYNYHKTLVDLGIEKKMPSDEQILKEVRFLWTEKFVSGFISPFGVPYKVETSPMRGMSNLFYKLKNKYVAQGNNEQRARDLAGDEMISLLGPNFMVDRVSFTGSSKELNIQPTYDAFKRVFEDNNELVGKLATIDKDDIGIVSLLTADLSRNENEKSTNIINILSNPDLKLPGTSKRINDFRLNPQEIERERIKQRTWNDYNLVRDALEEKITDGRSLRAHPELKAILDQLVETSFKNQSQAWYDEYQLSASGDTSYKWARAFNTIINDKKFMNNEAKGVRLWEDARLFINARNTIAKMYQSLPDYDPRKAIIRENYNQWTLQNSEQWDPTLQMYIKQYFDNDSLKVVE